MSLPPNPDSARPDSAQGREPMGLPQSEPIQREPSERSGELVKRVLRETDDAAREQARKLLSSSGHGALASLEPGTGWPLASRVAIALDEDGVPLILISRLAAHYSALERDARCSLLLGEVSDGEPLRHARITVLCLAIKVLPPQREAAKAQFLKRHPDAQLFADFSDFDYWRLQPERASLNAGFGKAYALTARDLQCPEQNQLEGGLAG